MFAERYCEEGWLKIGGLFDPDFIDQLRSEFERQYDALTAREQGYRTLGQQRFMLSVQMTGPFLDPKIYANPLLMTVLRQLLGSDIVIDSFACIVTFPGAEDQEPHRDHGKLFPEAPDLNWSVPPFGVLVAVPLVDLTPETGTTKMYPGVKRDPKANRAELPYINRGDCFLMDYRTKHQGTANRSSVARPLIYIGYVRPWFTDTINFRKQARINIDPADLPKIPEAYRLLFRRIAAKGGIDRSEVELFSADQ